MNRTPRRLAPLAALAALLLAACGPEFVPGSVLDDLRVLAVAPDRPDAAPGEKVTVRALTYVPPGETVTETWTFCPLTAGPSSGYRCVVPQCELPADPEAGGAVSATPSARALDCLASLGGQLPGDAGAGGALPPSIETVFRYTARSASGQERTAVARVPLYTSAEAVPAVRNAAPVIEAVRIGGAAATPGALAATGRPGAAIALEVAVDPASLQPYEDAAGRTFTESVVVSFFATAGRFPDGEDRDLAPLARTRLELVELGAADVEAQLYVVARDLRGGQAFAGPFRVAIERAP